MQNDANTTLYKTKKETNFKRKTMAKIIAPFQITGTFDDLSYYMSSGQNLVREKGKSGITKKQFKENPIFNKIRQQSAEFGSCVKKSRTFRLLVKQFYDKAKEVSFAGRVNKLLFEILEEDLKNERGFRKLEEGLATEEGKALLLDFEANKTRPLHKVLKKKIYFEWNNNELIIKGLKTNNDLNWPEQEANQVHFQLAIANWDYKNDKFENQYSEEITLDKKAQKATIRLNTIPLQSNNLWIAFLFVGFSNKERKKTKLLHKKWNTATCIAYKSFENAQP